MTPPADDAGFARWLATRTGESLLALRARFIEERRGDGAPAAPLAPADAAALRDTGDKHAHDLLVTELARWRHSDAVLSEEAARDDVIGRLAAPRLWILDPLDGTREFGEPGRVDWAVHVAFWRAGIGLAEGAVALPAQGVVLGTDQPPPTPRGGGDRPIRIVASRSRPPAVVTAVATALGAELVPMGSAGAKIAAVITGEVDAYLHAGGQYEWDSAAPVAVARATGLHTSRVDGSTLVYNQADPRLPDLLVCRPELADRLLAAIAAAEESP